MPLDRAAHDCVVDPQPIGHVGRGFVPQTRGVLDLGEEEGHGAPRESSRHVRTVVQRRASRSTPFLAMSDRRRRRPGPFTTAPVSATDAQSRPPPAARVRQVLEWSRHDCDEEARMSVAEVPVGRVRVREQRARQARSLRARQIEGGSGAATPDLDQHVRVSRPLRPGAQSCLMGSLGLWTGGVAPGVRGSGGLALVVPAGLRGWLLNEAPACRCPAVAWVERGESTFFMRSARRGSHPYAREARE